MASFYANQSIIGVDLNNPSSSAGFTLLQRVNGSSDSLFVYVLMNGAVTTGQCVAINAAGTAKPALSVDATSAINTLGFVQTAAADGQYVWAAQNGIGMYVAVSGSALAQSVTYLSATISGNLSTVATSCTLVGIQISNVSGSALMQVGTANLTWPKPGIPSGTSGF